MTFQDADQASPVDVVAGSGDGPGTVASNTLTINTTAGNDAILTATAANGTGSITDGAGQTVVLTGQTGTGSHLIQMSFKAAGTVAAAETMVSNFSPTASDDHGGLAIKSLQTITAATSSRYFAKVDDGSFNVYSYASTTNTWVVYDKKGTKYTYGSSDAGRMYDTTTGTSTKTYKWMLQEVRDTNDNYITYAYNRDNNVLYPYKIAYTGHGNTDGIDTVTFATSTRSDIRTNYASVFAATTTKLISQVTAAVIDGRRELHNLSSAHRLQRKNI
jgi:hypothetical protein